MSDFNGSLPRSHESGFAGKNPSPELHSPSRKGPRRGGRVAECAGLENRYARKGIESSNLSFSASVS